MSGRAQYTYTQVQPAVPGRCHKTQLFAAGAHAASPSFCSFTCAAKGRHNTRHNMGTAWAHHWPSWKRSNFPLEAAESLVGRDSLDGRPDDPAVFRRAAREPRLHMQVGSRSVPIFSIFQVESWGCRASLRWPCLCTDGGH